MLYILTFCFFCLFFSIRNFRFGCTKLNAHFDEQLPFIAAPRERKNMYGFRCRMPFRSSMHQLRNTLWILCLCLNLVRWKRKKHIFLRYWLRAGVLFSLVLLRSAASNERSGGNASNELHAGQQDVPMIKIRIIFCARNLKSSASSDRR